MKVLVIGATGLTGRHLIAKLLAKGDDVTAFARNPDAVATKNPKLSVAQGDARDGASLERAMQGQDAVVAAWGPRSMKKDDLQETLDRHLVAAMKKQGVRRLINLSAMGVGETKAQMPFFYRSVIIPLLLARLFEDKERGERLIRASGLDFVNIAPGRLNNRPARGGVKAAPDSKGLKLQMAREDLADFMIAQLTGGEWLGKTVFIGY